MGYDLHITRADNWMENLGSEILVDEWLALVEADPELQLDPVHGPYAVHWRQTEAAAQSWFDWCEGNVYTTDPDTAAVGKMLALATSLTGRVQGDDGEMYGAATEWVDRAVP